MLVDFISLSDLTARWLNHLMKYHQFIYHLLISSFRYELFQRKWDVTANKRSISESIRSLKVDGRDEDIRRWEKTIRSFREVNCIRFSIRFQQMIESVRSFWYKINGPWRFTINPSLPQRLIRHYHLTLSVICWTLIENRLKFAPRNDRILFSQDRIFLSRPCIFKDRILY